MDFSNFLNQNQNSSKLLNVNRVKENLSVYETCDSTYEFGAKSSYT